MHETEAGKAMSQRRAVASSASIAAPCSAVWELVSDFQRLDAWLPGVEMVAAAGGERGGERRFSIGAARFVERLTALDHAGRRLTYELLAGPLPVRDYEVTLSVSDAPGGHAQVEWSTLYRPHGIDADKCDRLLAKAFAGTLTALKRRCEGTNHG